MTKSEYIVWKCETLEQIKEEHPGWTEEQVQKYFSAVKAILENKGFFNWVLSWYIGQMEK